MSSKEEFWSGLGEGFLKGAFIGAVAAGVIGFGISLSLGAGFFPALLVGLFSPITLPGIALCLTAGTAFGIYRAIDDYIDARELERERKFATKLADIASQKPIITAEPANNITNNIVHENKNTAPEKSQEINSKEPFWSEWSKKLATPKETISYHR
jgi:hypothetical protein